MKSSFLWAMAVALVLLSATEATSQKPTLQKTDYDQWQSIRSFSVSGDGQWVNYLISPVEGNDTLYIKNIKNETIYEFPFGSMAEFSEDSKWAAIRIGFSVEETKRKQEKKQAIRYSLNLLNLETGEKEEFKEIQSFQFSKDGSFLAMKAYPPEKTKSAGSNLLLRNLNTEKTRNIGNVSQWAFNKKGDRLAYITEVASGLGNGVELFELDQYKLHVLASDTSKFLNLVWEKEGQALAFMERFYDTLFQEPSHVIYAIKNAYQPSDFQIIDPRKIAAFPDSMRIKETYKPFWSKDLSSMFFGIHEWTVKTTEKAKKNKEKEKKKIPGEDKLPGVEIWHWKDDPIQPRQKRTYTADRNFSYMSAWNFDSGKFVRLSYSEFDRGRFTGDQKHFYYYDVTPYRPQFRSTFADHYMINVQTGKKRMVLENHLTSYYTSPGGQYILYFKDNHWFTYDVYTNEHRNLTGEIDVPFWNIRYDGPMDIKPPVGQGGWLKGDEKLFLYDEYDIWLVSPDGSGAEKITAGREKEIRYRIRRLDYEEPYIDSDKDIYLSMFGDKTKNSGFARYTPDGKIEELYYEASSNSRLTKAKNADQFVFTQNTYTDSPDLLTTDRKFRKTVQLTNTNPQQSEYAWGRTELVSFRNSNGKELQGVLHYPANYTEGEKYPMLVYIYEIRSNSLHSYINPSRKSSYNITNYVQQGYFVFQPDIVYETNHPGESAVDCVVPAVEKVLATGKIDEKRIGLMGHSWGAYQTAFIITQSDLFSSFLTEWFSPA